MLRGDVVYHQDDEVVRRASSTTTQEVPRFLKVYRGISNSTFIGDPLGEGGQSLRLVKRPIVPVKSISDTGYDIAACIGSTNAATETKQARSSYYNTTGHATLALLRIIAQSQQGPTVRGGGRAGYIIAVQLIVRRKQGCKGNYWCT